MRRTIVSKAALALLLVLALAVFLEALLCYNRFLISIFMGRPCQFLIISDLLRFINCARCNL
jgi:hypothetical protein